ncbi:MAG: alcohol dehydrogenase catalytic domain-containing protein, partial [Planctomycetaceae bacterium]|nr:alcohol dehydrogenase catalytic domain-containing protein [Planctomycetaceae bacterium]
MRVWPKTGESLHEARNDRLVDADVCSSDPEGASKPRNDSTRADSPLLERSEWFTLLEAMGFETPISPETCEQTEQAATVVIARQPKRAGATTENIPTAEPPAETNWLIFADKGGVALQQAEQLRNAGCRCVLVTAGEQFEQVSSEEFQIDPQTAADMTRLRDEARLAKGNWAVAHFWSLDVASPDLSPSGQESAEAFTCHSVMHLVQSVATENPPKRLILITRGARDLADRTNFTDEDTGGAVQGALVGLSRVIASEYRQMGVRLIDLDPSDDATANKLYAELTTKEPQAEVAWRGPYRLIPRLEPIPQIESTSTKTKEPSFELTFTRSGDMSSAILQETEVTPPGPNQVQVEVHFVALNFRDVLKALGRYPAENPEQLAAGDECSGIVRAVGEGVTQFAPGDRVVVCDLGCF